MKEVITSGRTLDEATENALRMLRATRDDVEVDPLSAGSKGFLGFGRKPAKVRVTLRGDDRIRASVFMRNILNFMDIATSLQVKEDNEKIIITLGDEASVLIGRHGNTLDSLQYLLARFLNEDKDEWRKVVIDINNYRDRREDDLKDLALKLADQVIRSHRDVKTDPLTAPERRVIHMTLKESRPEVTTFSIGEGSRKRVVITSAEKGESRRSRPPRRRGGGSGRGNGPRPERSDRSDRAEGSRPPRPSRASDEGRRQESRPNRPPRGADQGAPGENRNSEGRPGGGPNRRRRPYRGKRPGGRPAGAGNVENTGGE